MISAREWNQLLASRRRNRVLSLSQRRGAAGRHPWFTTCVWNRDAEHWQATIKPGLVFNGRACDVTFDSVPLTDGPVVPLTTFRAIGTDAVSIDGIGEAVPEYFTARGVVDPLAITLDTEAGLTTEDQGDTSKACLLRACDIALHQERPRTTVDWSFGIGADGQFAQFRVGNAGALASKAYVRAMKQFTAIQPVDDLTRLQGGYDDDGIDSIKVCTVYLLSPAGAAYDSPPDETWTPHVKHDLFYNLAYGHTSASGPARQNLTLNLAGLGNAAGAQLTVNQLLAQSNDAANNALQFLLARESKGTFWSI